MRDVNRQLPAAAQIRVLAGDPPDEKTIGRAASALAVLKPVLQTQGKALVISGAGHFYRTGVSAQDMGIGRTLEIEYPDRTFVVIPVGGPLGLPPGITLRVHPDYRKFDRALKTPVRPVLVPVQRLPFRDFTSEEFLGGQILNCGGAAGCRSVFQGSPLTLGQMADALLYVGGA